LAEAANGRRLRFFKIFYLVLDIYSTETAKKYAENCSRQQNHFTIHFVYISQKKKSSGCYVPEYSARLK
jgi:hypothetical protein